MRCIIDPYEPGDIPQMISIWNTVVEKGEAFPQETCLDEKCGIEFFSSQTRTAVARTESGIAGLYILHPNNIGRCGHIANASYAVRSETRGQGIGEQLVMHSMNAAREFGFRLLQFNAVVAGNTQALSLYEKIGFIRLGCIPGGFRSKDGTYVDIIPHYIELV